MANKVQLQVFETRFKLKESEGIVTKIMVKNNMPKLFQVQTKCGTKIYINDTKNHYPNYFRNYNNPTFN